MSQKAAPFVAGLVGILTGVYIFQPIVLEQLKKDGALKPEYFEQEKAVEEALGDLTGDKPSKSS